MAIDTADMVRLAKMPAPQLLAETRSALVLVDVQNRFLSGPSTRVIEPIATLLRVARTQAVPRFYVTAGNAPAFSETAPWLRRLADIGSNLKARVEQPLSAEASAIPNPIAPLPDEVRLTKWRTSAFYETGLELLLRGGGIETVILCGVASYGCIIATYIDACSRGFFPLLCSEAVDGPAAALHDAAMTYMGLNCRIGAAEIVRIWMGATS